MRSELRRLLVVVAVLALVAQPMVGSVAATSTAATPDDENCSYEISDGWDFILNPIDGNPIREEERCSASRMAADLTHAQLYGSGLAQSDLRQAGTVPILNHLNESNTFVRTIIKTEAVEMFNNGTNRSTIEASLNDSIESYYATQQYNLLSTYSANINQTQYGLEASRQVYPFANESWFWTSNSGQYVIPYSETSFESGGTLDPTDSTTIWRHRNTTVQLADGTNMTVPMLVFGNDQDADGDLDDGDAIYRNTLPTMRLLSAQTEVRTGLDIHMARPENSLSAGLPGASNLDSDNSVRVFSKGRYILAYNETVDAVSSSQSEAMGFVDLLFTNYNQSSGAPVDEVLNANDLVTQYNTDYESTGYYGWLSAKMGLSGLSGNVNSSFSIEYTPRVDHTPDGNYTLNGSSSRSYVFTNGTTANMSGTLYTDWAPASTNGSFVRGTTYDTANATEPVIFIEQMENDSRFVRLNGTFTISSLTNVQSGEEINSTSLEDQNPQTWNDTDLTEYQALLEYRNQTLSSYEGASGGGGGWNLDASLTGGLVAGGGALLLILGGAFVLTKD